MDKNHGINENNDAFDEIIGYIEDILMETKFQEIQHFFLEKYWQEFDEVEENKLIYMDIFKEYHNTIENYLESSIKKVHPDFSMEIFITKLSEHGELEGEVFEILSAFNDFLAFKEMILDYRAMKEGKIADLGTGISVSGINVNNISG